MATHSNVGGARGLTLDGHARRPPIRESFAEPARAAAARAKDFHGTICVDAVGPAAVSDECLLLRKLPEALLEIVDRHRERSRDVTGGVLPRRPRVEDDDVAGSAAAEQ